MADYSTGLSQVIRISPRYEFLALANQHHAGQKFPSFSRWTQFVALLTVLLTGCDSLRDIVESMTASPINFTPLGIKPFSRATLNRCQSLVPRYKAQKNFMHLSLGSLPRREGWHAL